MTASTDTDVVTRTHLTLTAGVSGVAVATGHWIGGVRVDPPDMSGAGAFEDHSPIDGTLVARVARGGAAEVDRAVAAARHAATGWAATSRAERAELLHAIADGVDARREELALVETTDNGALLRSHRRGVMPRVAHNFRFFADYALGLDDPDSHPDFDTRGHRNHVTWDPAGVAALISPWNAPLMLATWKIAPALAAGDTVVLKPSEWSPLTASLLADITAAAGLPPGVFNIVQGLGGEAGAALAAHPGVARISFTGSVPTGRLVARAAAANLTPVSLELGGKSPFIVFDDADLDLALDAAIEQYDNAGQVCLAGSRLLVQDTISEEFTRRFVARAAALRQGDPRDPATDIGPQIHPDHLARVDGFVQRAIASGATVLLGGGRNTDLGGLYYRPTLLGDVAEGTEILTEEVFGPVLTVATFSGEDQAVDQANSTDFGLAAVLFTGDLDRAERVGAQLVAGTVWVNCFYVRDLRAPFGGARNSGVGREGGTWSFDFFCDVKNTVLAPGGWRDGGVTDG